MHQANSAQWGAFSLKKLLIGLGIIAALSGSVQAAGTIPFSLSQQFDSLGKPLANCFFYTIQAGTTSTPQNAYQDSALTLAQPNPMRCDAAGRLPQFFLADGLIKVRITDKNGVPQNYPNGSGSIDNIQVIGPSGGGGGGGTVDPTTILATGDFKDVYGTGVLTGFVRCNARTIGSATSGATERANADTSGLFNFLWQQDANLAVSGGRGVSSAADFAANKTITLPDCRSRARVAMSDMGNADSTRISATYFGCTGLVLGCAGGAESITLVAANLPPYTPSGTVGAPTISTSNGDSVVTNPGTVGNSTPGGGGASPVPSSATSFRQATLSSSAPTFTGTAAPGQISTPHKTVQPSILVTTYIKL